MGNAAASAGDGNSNSNGSGRGGKGTYDLDKVGYRVLGVQQDSPASPCGFCVYFDFIVAAAGVRLTTLDSSFVDIIQAHEDRELRLTVYNCKSRETREVSMVPSRSSWSGDGLLGVTIRFDSYANADENVCRVVAVGDGEGSGGGDSPAELAGLQGDGTDYILGSAERVYSDMDVLLADLQANLDRPMELFVYSSSTDAVRVVVVMPTADWGGGGDRGILGATIAHGYLHGLPSFRAEAEAGATAVANGSPASASGPAVAASPSPPATSTATSDSHIKVQQSPFGAHRKLPPAATGTGAGTEGQPQGQEQEATRPAEASSQ